MIVAPVPVTFDLLATDLVRSPGLHASTIYSELFAELEPARFKYDSPPNPLLLALGTAWEKHLEFLLEKNGIRAERPTEFMSPEGIAFSPDLLLYNGVVRLGEIKYTSMGTNGISPTEVTNSLPAKMGKYDCQMRLYAHWLGLRDGWLAVLFNNKPWNPELRIFEITWTDQEIQENFEMCMNYARHKGYL